MFKALRCIAVFVYMSEQIHKTSLCLHLMTKFYWDITFLCLLGLLELACKRLKTKNNKNNNNKNTGFILSTYDLLPSAMLP